MSTNIARLNASILGNEHRDLEKDFHEFKDELKEILERLARIEPHLRFIYVYNANGDGEGVAPGNDRLWQYVRVWTSQRQHWGLGIGLAGSTDERASVPGAVTNGDQDPESKANSEALKSPLAESKLVIEGFNLVRRHWWLIW